MTLPTSRSLVHFAAIGASVVARPFRRKPKPRDTGRLSLLSLAFSSCPPHVRNAAPRDDRRRRERHYRPGRTREKTPSVALSGRFAGFRPTRRPRAQSSRSTTVANEPAGRRNSSDQRAVGFPFVQQAAHLQAQRAALLREPGADEAARRDRETARSPAARSRARAPPLRSSPAPISGPVGSMSNAASRRARSTVQGSGPKIECVPASIQTSPSSAAIPAAVLDALRQHRVEQQRARRRQREARLRARHAPAGEQLARAIDVAGVAAEALLAEIVRHAALADHARGAARLRSRSPTTSRTRMRKRLPRCAPRLSLRSCRLAASTRTSANRERASSRDRRGPAGAPKNSGA